MTLLRNFVLLYCALLALSMHFLYAAKNTLCGQTPPPTILSV